MRNKIVHGVRDAITKGNDVLLDFIAGFMVSSHPEWNPRFWSNQELKRIAGKLNGSVVNVSAAEDSDKNGGKYQDYFSSAKSYCITNYGYGEEGTCFSSNEKILDLTEEYDGRYGQFDIVLNHTVIEHLPSVNTAIDNLCALSGDIVITIVPFIQGFHGRLGGYTDYWRYSPLALISEFDKRGFSTVYLNWNNHHPLMNVYIIHIASRHPERHSNIFNRVKLPIVNASGPGVGFSRFLWGWGRLEGKSRARKIGEMFGCRLIP